MLTTTKSNYSKFYYPEQLQIGSQVEASVSTGFLRFLPANKTMSVSIWMPSILPSVAWTTMVKSCKQVGYNSFVVEVDSDVK
jgi:hypothetical protein